MTFQNRATASRPALLSSAPVGRGVILIERSSMQLPRPLARPAIPPQLRVMPEYVSSGLWCPRLAGTPERSGSNTPIPVRECDPVTLGLSAALRTQLDQWCAQYERLDVGIPGNQPDMRQFAAEGLAIAHALQAELPEVEVWYFDEALYEKGRPRREYLYRVSPRS